VAGFSLIETMLSVGLLSVVVIGAMAAFGGVAKVSSGNPARDAAEWEMRRTSRSNPPPQSIPIPQW